MSYWHREETSDVYDHITPKRQDAINILLAHGGDAKHIPFSPAKIIENGFDYIAARTYPQRRSIRGHVGQSGTVGF